VINGKVLNGAQGIAGEWGHNFLDVSGGACYCGKTGCVETVLSGTGLQQYYQTLTGNQLSLPEISQRYNDANDAAAKATI
jgi:fructokinase